jgi:hypothetical protein
MVSAVTTAAAPSIPLVKRSSDSLTAMSDNKDGRYTMDQQREAGEKLNAREYAAFGHLAGSGSSWGIRDTLKAYVKYVEGLPPEEQQSDRYRGTMAPTKAMISQFDAYIQNNHIPDTRKGGGKNEKIPDSPIVEMLKKGEEALAKHAAKKTKDGEEQNASDSNPVNVTLSTAALEILKASAAKDDASGANGQGKRALSGLADAGAGGVLSDERQGSGISKLFKGFDKLRKAVG